MESSVEVSQTGGTSSPKPALAPKPRLTPKPFSLQKNTTIRSINAPKTARVTSKTTTQQTEKSKAASVPKPPLTTPARKPPQQTTTSDSKPGPVGGLTKDLPKTTRESKASPHGEDTPDSGVGKFDPVTQTAPPKETPESKPTRRDDVIQANHKASADVVNSAEIDGKKKEDKTQTSVIQSLEESASDVSSVNSLANRWGGSRKRLSMELTSRFESAGLSLPPQPTATISTTGNTEDANKPEPPDPEPSLTTPEPSNIESEEGAPKEDYSGGGSIKRRISLLFDSSSRPEALTKRDELENVNGMGSVKGVKERIKKWAVEKTPEGPKTEKQPRVAPRNRSKSFEPATAPTAEKTPKIPPAEPPVTGTLSSQAVDLSSKAEQPMETSTETSKDAPTEFKSSDSSRVEHTQNKSAEGYVQLRNRSSFKTQTATDEGDSNERESGQHAPKRDNVKRRSVRFGVVERDDGGPPVILGSATDSSEEEEEASEDEAEKKIPVSVPVYTRVGSLQRKDDDDEERLKHLEFERRRRAEEHEQAPLKLEEERQRKEEEERERERARQKEEEERERERARQKEEEERERERARQKEEEERERERARQKEEEERERERRKEEDVERQKKEERERERLQEEERKRERLREEEMEREKQMQLLRQRQREEERERAKQKEERLKQDQEEREKERLKEEEREKESLKEEERKEERLREERENQKLREKKINKKKQREEEWEQEWVKRTESLRGEEEEKELELMYQRKTEEDRERARQNEERLSEERERQRLREERLNDNFEDYRLEGKLREKEINKKKQREEEWEQEWVKKTERLSGEEEEKEREKELELMYQRKTEEDKERARQKEERLRQEEREEERLREEAKERERERQRRLKEHEEKEEMERVRRIESERQIEEERRKEERKRQAEKERVEESERRIRQELDRKREQEAKEKLRLEEERGREERERAAYKAESNLISFDSEDVPQKSESPNYPVAKSYQPTKSQEEVVYDDFSVRPPLANVDFDDFSVKPKRWGSQAKVETSPPTHSWSAVSEDKEDVQAPPDTVTLLGYRVLEQVEKPDSPEPTLAQERPEEEEEEEEQLISMEVEEEEGQKETQREEAEETNEDGVEEEDEQEAPVNSYSTNDEDTDALISNEPDEQNGACEQTSEIDSPKLVPDQVPEVSEDVDTTDFPSEPEHAPFPESSTNLLDTSAQRSKADLGKRRNRTRPPSSLRGGFPLGKSPDWRIFDSTDGKEASSKQRDSDSEEEQPKPKIVCSPPPTSQRVPMFPGLSPAALIAQLKKRTTGGGTGGGEEAEEDKGREEKESQNEEVALPPSQLSRSPRPAGHLAGAARVLPPIGGMDGGAVSSPAWLKELKSKKRLSQYDSET